METISLNETAYVEITVSTLWAQTRNVEFIETTFTGGMDLIVVRYSEE
jgi:hypothetical protein